MIKFMIKCLLSALGLIGLVLLLKEIIIYTESMDEIDAPVDYEKQ